ncbi:hypothetical protein CFC21_038907 [Triticum aestivum]|uniref:Uncharacterized protein n=2 Tax=Triticum aestivum TaxID=4565 RepID=A0A9R1JRI1_WHEAT|nr:hypothetical protein CFC21_038907 [Triticum aestivum]CDM80244.1 unnamed protein product [Triticum aestivum]
MKRASVSSAMAILVILFICYSLPCSAADQAHTEGNHVGVSPPSPWVAPGPHNQGRGRSSTPPPVPHRKNLQLQQAVLQVPLMP